MNGTVENVKIASQGCLMSSGDKGSMALQNVFHEKLDSLSREGQEKNVEVDPSGMLPCLKESNVCHHDDVEEAVERGKQLRLGNMEGILPSKLADGGCGANKRLSIEEDVTLLG